MKTRRNKKNEIDGLQKLKDIRESQKYLVNILVAMKEKEQAKKNLIMLQQMEFEGEVALLRHEKRDVEEKYREFMKFYVKQKIPSIIASPDHKREERIKIINEDKENYNRNQQKSSQVITELKLHPKDQTLTDVAMSTQSISDPERNKKYRVRNNKPKVK